MYLIGTRQIFLSNKLSTDRTLQSKVLEVARLSALEITFTEPDLYLNNELSHNCAYTSVRLEGLEEFALDLSKKQAKYLSSIKEFCSLHSAQCIVVKPELTPVHLMEEFDSWDIDVGVINSNRRAMAGRAAYEIETVLQSGIDCGVLNFQNAYQLAQDLGVSFISILHGYLKVLKRSGRISHVYIGGEEYQNDQGRIGVLPLSESLNQSEILRGLQYVFTALPQPVPIILDGDPLFDFEDIAQKTVLSIDEHAKRFSVAVKRLGKDRELITAALNSDSQNQLMVA